MSSLMLFILLSVHPVQSDSAFESIGTWSNVVVSESEDPHAAGFELQLWRHDNEILGYLSEFVGPLGDPPIGKLENIVFDESTGEISFFVRMSIGLIHSGSDENWVPSKDVYLFSGKMDANRISGNLEHKILNSEEQSSVIEELTLKGGKQPDQFWKDKSYEEWEEFYKLILNSRGPKW